MIPVDSTWRGPRGPAGYCAAHAGSPARRTITAAALIMVAVFSGFILGSDPVVKMMGVGLATAIFLDATVVRVVLVPATMKLLGDANWCSHAGWTGCCRSWTTSLWWRHSSPLLWLPGSGDVPLLLRRETRRT